MGDYSPPHYTGPDDDEIVAEWEDNCDLPAAEKFLKEWLGDADSGVGITYNIPSDELYDVEIEIRDRVLELLTSLRERIEIGNRRITRICCQATTRACSALV